VNLLELWYVVAEFLEDVGLLLHLGVHRPDDAGHLLSLQIQDPLCKRHCIYNGEYKERSIKAAQYL